MTNDDFDKQEWHLDMKCKFNGRVYDILAVEFYTRTLTVSSDDFYDGFRAKAKDIELINI